MPNTVFCLAFLTDDSLASGYLDSTILIWIIQPQILTGHSDIVWLLAALPKDLLESDSMDLTIRIWNTSNGQTILILIGHTHWISSLAALPDGSLASCSYDATIRIWNITTGRVMQMLRNFKINAGSGRIHDYASSGFVSLVVLHDGLLASGGMNHRIQIWNTTTGKIIKTLEIHDSGLNTLFFLPDGLLVSGGRYYFRIRNTTDDTIINKLALNYGILNFE